MQVEVWADIVCPWCGLGKHRLDAALSRIGDRDEIRVVHRSFQLDPNAAAEPSSVRDLLKHKYGLDDKGFAEVTGRVEGLAQAEGLTPYFVGDNLTGNTFLAHQWLALAGEYGLHEEGWNRIYRAHFGERRSIFSVDSLVELGTEIGLDAGEVRNALDSGLYAAQVDADGREARRLGATGVPFLVIDRKYVVSGAQSPEVLLQVFDQVRDQAGAGS